MIDTNLIGAFYAIRAIATDLMVAVDGRIVLIGPVAASKGTPGQVGHAASKGRAVLGVALVIWLVLYSESVGHDLMSRRAKIFGMEVAAALQALLALCLVVLGLVGAFADREVGASHDRRS